MLFKLIKWWDTRRERKYLGGFTIEELNQFRKNCVGLCVPTGTVFHVKHPTTGQTIQFYPSALPRFEFGDAKYNVSYPKTAKPHWFKTDKNEPTYMDLKSADAKFINALLKKLVEWFPFAPQPLTTAPIV